jgi:hypothetical protein
MTGMGNGWEEGRVVGMVALNCIRLALVMIIFFGKSGKVKCTTILFQSTLPWSPAGFRQSSFRVLLI